MSLQKSKLLPNPEIVQLLCCC